jgi:hypothetical protein
MIKKYLYSDPAMLFYFNMVIFFLQLLFNCKSFTLHTTLKFPLIFYKQIFFALFIQLLIVIGKALIENILLIDFKRLKMNWNAESALVVIFLCNTVFLYLVNALLFPLSLSGIVIKNLFLDDLGLKIGAIFFGIIIGALILNSCYYRLNYKIFSLLIISLLLNATFEKPRTAPILHDKTNVFIIGIDSLPASKVTQNNMPFLYHWLNNNVNFANTITPLAKTTASWFSILTGLEPKQHGANENLIPQSYTKHHSSIAWKFKKLGYKTIFATDERRFNNMDQEMGFDTIIGPQIGAADFIIPKIFDFPISNLLIVSGKFDFLFRFQNLNRSSIVNFIPKKFDDLINHYITNIDSNKPVFWASHFNMPHWPYIIADSSIKDSQEHQKIETLTNTFIPIQYQHYLEILKRTDYQLKLLYKNLEQKGLLTNSIIVILSDHGETFYQPNSRSLTKNFYKGNGLSAFKTWLYKKTGTRLSRSRGHGNDLMSLDQYTCVFGMRVSVNNKILSVKTKYKSWVSLIDIAPTILEILDPTINSSKFDGVSLKSSIFHKVEPLKRKLSLSSGLIAGQNLPAQKIAELANKLYKINKKTGFLEMKPDILSQQLVSIGTLYYPWLKVMFSKNHKIVKTVIINLFSKQWTDNLTSKLAKEALKYV